MEPTYRIEQGYLVGYFPGLAPMRTSLRRVARACSRMGHQNCRPLVGADWSAFEGMAPDQVITGMESPEVGWGFLKKVGRGFKKLGKGALKATKTVMRVAHKITHNKVFEAIHEKVKKLVPEPYKTLVKLQNPLQKATKNFVAKFSGADKGARAIAPAIRAAGQGIISAKELEKQAKKLGVDVDEAKAVATLAKLEKQAKSGDKSAAVAMRAMELLRQVEEGKPGRAIVTLAETEIRRAMPSSTAHNVTTSKGRRYRAILVPLPKAS